MSLLHNRYFIAYCAKVSATNLGYTLYMITVPAYAFLASRNILFTGLVLFIEYGIYSVTFFAGPLVDKVEDKRYIISASEVGIGIAALALGISMLYYAGNLYLFLLLVGVIAVLWDVAWTADHAVLPLIVEGEELGRGNGFLSALGNGHTAAGLAIGGFFFAVLQPFYSILLYSACLLFSGIVVLAIPLRIQEKHEKSAPGFRVGWAYLIRENRTLIFFAVVIAAFSIFSNAPVLAVAYLYGNSSPFTYSALFSTFYIGSMASGLLLARKFPSKSIGKILLISYLAFGILLFPAVQKPVPLAALVIIWALLGFTFSLHTPLFSTYLQSLTKKDMLGRSASNLYTFRGITSTAGSLLIPLIMAEYGINTSFLAFGTLVVILSIMLIAFNRNIRGLAL